MATLASGEPTERRHDYSRLLYFAHKRNKCNYLINTGAAVSVLRQSCANGTADTGSSPLVAANNTTITKGTCKRVVDVGIIKRLAG